MLQHYVPKFYLQQFAGQDGRLWVWDKIADRIFQSTAKNIACETNFYTLQHSTWPNANVMEEQFSSIESFAAECIEFLLLRVHDQQLGSKIHIETETKRNLSQYIALQFLRTADARDTMTSLLPEGLTNQEIKDTHINLLWDNRLVDTLTDRLANGSWIFALNKSERAFITSDNPVCFRTNDNKKWLKAGVLELGVYAVFPLSPAVVVYIFPDQPMYNNVKRNFGDSVSPAEFTAQHADYDNTGQVFMASRFLIGSTREFSHERHFLKTIRYV